MATGFRIDFLWYQVGQGDFLHAFFSTICYRLEKGLWGSKFPYLMNDLYHIGLEWTDVPLAGRRIWSGNRQGGGDNTYPRRRLFQF